MNLSWCLFYPKARVSHLTRCHLDHYPVLIETNPRRAIHLNRPFRFEDFWLLDLSCPTIVSNAWGSNRNLMESIDIFSREATIWNRDHFGNIHQKKRQIMARIYGTQKALSNHPCTFLITLENQLQQELEAVRIKRGICGC